MDCRLFVDEVGNDDLDHPRERYLSLTGIITKIRGCDNQITPQIEGLKEEFFDHRPPHKVVILHRRELIRREPPYQALNDPDVNADWEAAVLGLIEKLPYKAITVMIDKHEHKDKYKVWQFNPYHYCMTALVERYVLWLNRHHLTGDVIAETRFKRVDRALKESFQRFYHRGSDNIPPAVVQRCLTTRELKLEPKKSNVSGLQLVELLANPSHAGTKAKYTKQPSPLNFGSKIYAVLEAKTYCRNPKKLGIDGIDGWGQKWLP